MKTLLLLFNPTSGVQKFAGQLFDVVNLFTAAGYLVSAYPTQCPGDVRRMVAQHSAAFSTLVVAGGDGTVGEGIDALLAIAPQHRPDFGIIPCGTVNDFAGSLGIPKNALSAAQVIISGSPRALDMGRLEHKHFSYVAAFGMFTDVSYATPQSAKNLLGKLAYFFEGAKRIAAIESFACELVLDGTQHISGEFLLGMVANSHSVAGFKFPKTMNTQLDDGLFEVILIPKPASFKQGQDMVAALLTADATKADMVTLCKARTIDFSAHHPVPWTLDGDFGGAYTTAHIANLHRALEIIT